jgi:hypothetical protein
VGRGAWLENISILSYSILQKLISQIGSSDDKIMGTPDVANTAMMTTFGILRKSFNSIVTHKCDASQSCREEDIQKERETETKEKTEEGKHKHQIHTFISKSHITILELAQRAKRAARKRARSKN